VPQERISFQIPERPQVLGVWLFEAKKRYRLRVLNYMATSNHIHLLVLDSGERETIPRSIQLIAGRTAQEFNQRKRQAFTAEAQRTRRKAF
jgi:REP element-mobilizing transposase RayT